MSRYFPTYPALLSIALSLLVTVPARADFKINWTATARDSQALYTTAMAMDQAGNLYTVSDGGQIYFWPKDGGNRVLIGIPSILLDSPRGIAVDDEGSLYFSDTNNRRVVKMDVHKNVSLIEGFTDPEAMVGLAQGVLVADGDDGSIKQVDTSNQVTTVKSGLDNPRGIARDRARSQIYYTQHHGDDAGVYRVDGGDWSNPQTIVESSAVEDSKYPAVAVDGDGDVYFAYNQSLFVRPHGSTTDEAVPSFGGIRPSLLVGLPDHGIVAGMPSSVGGPDIWELHRGNGLPVAAVCAAANPSADFPCSVQVEVRFHLDRDTEFDGSLDIGAAGLTQQDFKLAATDRPFYCADNGDCDLVMDFAPHMPGLRSAALTLRNPDGSLYNVARVAGQARGPLATFPAAKSILVRKAQYEDGAYPAVDQASNMYYWQSDCVRRWTPLETPCIYSGAEGYGDSQVVTADGSFFTSDVYRDEISVHRPSQPNFGDPLSGFDKPSGLAIDFTGNLLAVEAGQNRLTRYDLADNSRTVVANNLDRPRGVAVGSDGSIYLTESGQVRRIGRSGESTFEKRGLEQPISVAVDAAGTLFVVDATRNAVLMYPADGSTPVPILGEFPSPNTVVVAPNGDVYVWNGTLTTGAHVYFLERSAPADVHFAGTLAGQSSTDSPRTVSLMNSGNEPLTLEGYNLQDSTNFHLSSDFPGSCSASQQLAPGSSCSVKISFTPQAGTDAITFSSRLDWVTNSLGLRTTHAELLQGDRLRAAHLSFSPGSGAYKAGGDLTLTASSLSEGAITYTLVEGDAQIVARGGAQHLLLGSSGSVLVKATQVASGAYISESVVNSYQILQDPQLAFAPASGKSDVNANPTLIAHSESSGAVAFRVLSGEAWIDSAGGQQSLQFGAPGTVVVEARQAAAGTYDGSTVQNTYQVFGDSHLSFLPASANVRVHDRTVLTGQSLSATTIQYSVVQGQADIRLVGHEQVLTFTTPGTVVVAAQQEEHDHYGAATVKHTFQVYPIWQGMTLSEVSSSIPPKGPGSATFTFLLTPALEGLAASAHISVTGLPAEDAFTVSPETISAGAGPTLISLSITRKSTNTAPHHRSGSIALLALLFGPIVAARRRRTHWPRLSQQFIQLFLVGSTLAGIVGLSGCGGGSSQIAPENSVPVTLTISTGAEQVSVTVLLYEG